ncbi:hypothetical protein KKG22_05015 [Patescibacteria group bacterium]|nr:hypothetical protein [Patescibacteria group bacterium]MBU1721695.1 hypothetical protein [Patescibacteria group bacterium]
MSIEKGFFPPTVKEEILERNQENVQEMKRQAAIKDIQSDLVVLQRVRAEIEGLTSYGDENPFLDELKALAVLDLKKMHRTEGVILSPLNSENNRTLIHDLNNSLAVFPFTIEWAQEDASAEDIEELKKGLDKYIKELKELIESADSEV